MSSPITVKYSIYNDADLFSIYACIPYISPSIVTIIIIIICIIIIIIIIIILLLLSQVVLDKRYEMTLKWQSLTVSLWNDYR